MNMATATSRTESKPGSCWETLHGRYHRSAKIPDVDGCSSTREGCFFPCARKMIFGRLLASGSNGHSYGNNLLSKHERFLGSCTILQASSDWQCDCICLRRCSRGPYWAVAGKMPGISQRRFHSTIRGPASEALDLLAPHNAEILAAWRASLSGLNVDPDKLLAADFDFGRLAEYLRNSEYPAFRQGIQEYGQHVAQQVKSLDLVVAAFNRLFEACLPPLTREAPKRA